MTRKIQIFACLSLCLTIFKLMGSISETQASSQFTTANIRFEYNETDKDIELVIEAKGGIEGLANFKVVSPEGRPIINVNAPVDTLGWRHFSIESPEPKDIKSLKKAYPEGEYQFIGLTSSGIKLNTKATLNHVLAAPSSVVHPKPNAERVNIKNLEIAWSSVKNAVAYIVSIEQIDSDIQFTAKLPGSTTTLLVPNGFLLPGKEYNLGIGTVTSKGNITYIETSFTTDNS